MKILPFKAIYPNFELISSPDIFFDMVKHNYPEYVKNGFFHSTVQKSVYIFEIKSRKRTHIGLLACVDIDSYRKGEIVKHELTLASKEQTMTNLLLQRQAMVKPVLLGYEPNAQLEKTISALIKKHRPFFKVSFKEEKQAHFFYKIDREEAEKSLIDQFDQLIDKVYIADGHHRCSTSYKLHLAEKRKGNTNNRYRKLLCAFFPFDQLGIHDYNRVVDILNDFSPARVMALISLVFDIEVLKKGEKPKHKHVITMYINHEWYRLTWKASVFEKYKKSTVLLDAELLNKELLSKHLKIRDVRMDERIKYVDGISGVQGLVDKAVKSETRIGFCIYPVQIEELVKIADSKETLPPKSTWFEPRIKNGMIVKAFDE